MDRPPIMQRLFQRIEHEPGMRGAAGAPADDASGEGVDDEGDVDKALPGGNVGEIRHPQHVRPRCDELAIDVIQRARCGLVADGGAYRLAADNPL